ncbi:MULTISPECIES: fumarylacetoacetate hydrolase family protein [Bacillaceae]|uniref:Fumarylacetoacetate hydrolase family protein n=1 Tax=Evansella alkalicola TaxID=745819 RepID=A0ABS6K1E3_9BACI|nr:MULTISPECIES: fumarylacetoacetate hydrolase family protein [Bacillaceae]MBU9723195.1 fumarylacetoacetate hydrolase family protein [Bacillus alkalicola]
MKFLLFDDFQLGLLKDDQIYDIGTLLFGDMKPYCPMVELIQNYEKYKKKIENAYSDAARVIPLSDVRLRQPVSRPGKVVATPVNYLSHKKEMNVQHTARGLGFFLKANSSIIGPSDVIELPYEDRRIDHELEMAFVIGKKAKNVKREDAHDYIFGYTGLNDVSLRPTEDKVEERCLRKSFDTFTPMGPWIVTSDEIGDPQDLEMSLFVNDEKRQKVNTRNMIVSIAEQLEIFSHIMTLEPGDVVATGTPDGVGPLKDGDIVTIYIEKIGTFKNSVVLKKR